MERQRISVLGLFLEESLCSHRCHAGRGFIIAICLTPAHPHNTGYALSSTSAGYAYSYMQITAWLVTMSGGIKPVLKLKERLSLITEVVALLRGNG